MAPQTLFIDRDTGRVSSTPESPSGPLIVALHRAALKIDLIFHSGAVPAALPEGSSGRLVVKKHLDHAGSPVLMDADWEVLGAGSNQRYRFELLADSDPLRALLAGKDSVQVAAQVEWSVVGEAAPRLSQPFTVQIVQAYVRDDDGAPDITGSLVWAWLKSRLAAGDNVTLAHDESAKVITIHAEGGGASTWEEIAGKPNAFPPLSHSHFPVNTVASGFQEPFYFRRQHTMMFQLVPSYSTVTPYLAWELPVLPRGFQICEIFGAFANLQSIIDRCVLRVTDGGAPLATFDGPILERFFTIMPAGNSTVQAGGYLYIELDPFQGYSTGPAQGLVNYVLGRWLP